MTWKSFVLNIVWGLVSFAFIAMFSTQDKEWFIGEEGINNICDLMTYIENDDIRDVGIIITLPFFIPYIYAIVRRKQRNLWQYFIVAALLSYWLWRFIFRYQLCV
ncbi:putative inner membrane protein [Trabulsiella guamensis ATCC 49490]|uniref:Putative inner membrane protein n=1 Tax=Trabulsiella guamensis ATCC 49490 TaxID=1005994 RepID=A0A085AAN2_9ENTR|nr:YjeO family protein [Trabulsiella guamensis]KFC07277.1 putative inner membrane protein [Trabulsiella guamensis ATCC 49490]